MEVGRSWTRGAALACAALALLPGCRPKKAGEVNDITPKIEVNRSRAPLGSAVEITYTWQVGPEAKKLAQDHRAFVHFVDQHGVMLFEDDHVPAPSVTQWEPGQSYSYTRTKFIPVYPYVGDVDIRTGLFPVQGGERVAMKGEDTGLREYAIAKMELLPQTENIFLVYKEGWHNPESSPQNPSLERTWTKKDALVAFKNPKKDIVIYLEADTNHKAFEAPPVLTVAVNGKSGLTIPIENSEVFIKKIKVPAAELGSEEWVDLRLAMNSSFVPKTKGVHPTDDRELGVMVYHLYVAEADKLGAIQNVVAAQPVKVGPMLVSTTVAPGTASPTSGAPAKASPGAKASPAEKASS